MELKECDMYLVTDYEISISGKNNKVLLQIIDNCHMINYRKSTTNVIVTAFHDVICSIYAIFQVAAVSDVMFVISSFVFSRVNFAIVTHIITLFFFDKFQHFQQILWPFFMHYRGPLINSFCYDLLNQPINNIEKRLKSNKILGYPDTYTQQQHIMQINV